MFWVSSYAVCIQWRIEAKRWDVSDCYESRSANKVDPDRQIFSSFEGNKFEFYDGSWIIQNSFNDL